MGLHSGSSFEFGSNEILFLLFISFSGFPVCAAFSSRPFCLAGQLIFHHSPVPRYDCSFEHVRDEGSSCLSKGKRE